MKVDYKDIAIRAAKTFGQAFFATLALGLSGVTNLEDGKVVLISAATAGLAALFSFVQNWIVKTA